MTTFGAYAHFYDTLYKDKNYSAECDFVERQIKAYSSHSVSTILDLGCGTGKHARELASRKYSVTGVDRSAEMLEEATKNTDKNSAIDYVQGDLTSVRLNKTFDAVTCLFAVISYVTDNQALVEAFKTVALHLKPGGIFVTDFWYGPAVLKDPPQERVKSLPHSDSEIIRQARGELRENDNQVDVHYRILQRKGDRILSDVKEMHSMRYFFKPELELLASMAGLKLELLCDFINEKKPASISTWCTSAVFKKK